MHERAHNTKTAASLRGPKLEYDVCSRCSSLFDDQGENGWWFETGQWFHECAPERPARIVVRRMPRVAA